MPGALVFVVAMVLVVPVGVMLVGAVWSALFGWLESADADAATDVPSEG
ncbi:MAG TPA: hypothetical protein VN180_10165 [Acidimicrobiia bacterium]|jgi:hypothetical protein|nr:hypothetical protein [Acidimicrobiia bacterium]